MTTELDAAAEEFQRIRPRLFGIGYRMLGSATEADDVVQEAWIRWQGTDRASIEDPIAFLSTVTSRLALNVATSARARRETYIGPWLPEPVADDDPAFGAEVGESLDLAILLLMERLKPIERAVYVLRNAFNYPFTQVAEILEISESNARQLAHRAREHMTEPGDQSASRPERRRLLEAFIRAARSGDVASLERVLAEDVVAYADGGGVVTASRRPIEGIERVTQFIRGGAKFLGGAVFTRLDVNGQPAMLVTVPGEAATLFAIDVEGGRIRTILAQRNPSKLARLLSQMQGVLGLPE